MYACAAGAVGTRFLPGEARENGVMAAPVLPVLCDCPRGKKTKDGREAVVLPPVFCRPLH